MNGTGWNSAKHIVGLVLPLLLAPCTASAEIYRCESKGETYFSQIPCNDEAQAVVIEDRQMFSTPAAIDTLPPSAREAAQPSVPARTPADNLKEFVETLNRQRNDEIAKVDSDISGVRKQLAEAEGRPADDPEQIALDEQLSELQASRESISRQYDSMIMEAERRVTEMSASSRAVAKTASANN